MVKKLRLVSFFNYYKGYFSAFTRLSLSKTNSVSINYINQVPLEKKVASGGSVKLLELNKQWPEKNEANLVYNVSSIGNSDFQSGWIDYCKKIGMKIVLNQNGVAHPHFYGKKFKEINAPMSYNLLKSDFIIYQSKFCKKSADHFLGKTELDSKIIYNSVDTNHFKPQEDRNFSAEAPVILLGGNQYEKYRFDLAIEIISHIVKKIPRAKLLITGKLNWNNDDDNNIKYANDKISRLGLKKNIEFIGSYMQSEAPDLYNRSDILLHTKHYDPCPTTVIEAMSCGLPVIFSNSGGTKEIVNEESGVGLDLQRNVKGEYVLNTKDALSALDIIINNYHNFSSSSRKRVIESFDSKKWIEEHLIIFKTLLK